MAASVWRLKPPALGLPVASTGSVVRIITNFDVRFFLMINDYSFAVNA